MNTTVRDAFELALASANERVISLPHPSGRFLVQNYYGRPALVARVSLVPEQTPEGGRGYFVSTQKKEGESFVRVVSDDHGITLIFLKLVDYVLERTAVAKSHDEFARLMTAAIEEFRSFSQRRSGRLSEDEIRGLVAELSMVLRLHSGDDSRTWAIFQAWGGPFGSLRDFEFPDGRSLEIKSTHRATKEIRVSSDQQLRPSGDGLELAVLPLERVSSDSVDTVSFVEIVQKVSALAAKAGSEVARLWDDMQNALSLDISDEYYERWTFEVGAWELFEVRDEFPVVDDKSLSPGLIKIAYSIQLDSLTEFAVNFEELKVAL